MPQSFILQLLFTFSYHLEMIVIVKVIGFIMSNCTKIKIKRCIQFINYHKYHYQ